jgi:aminopeptidase N
MLPIRTWLSLLYLFAVLITAQPVQAQVQAQPTPPPAAKPPAAAAAVGKETAPPTEPLRTAADRPFDIRDILLDLHVNLEKKTVEAQATLQLQSLRPIKSLTLDAVGFEVKKVTLSMGDREAAPAHYTHDGKNLIVQLDPAWPAGRKGTLRVDYIVKEPKDGLHFFAPKESDPEAPLQVWSQGETTSNSHWFPCRDVPDYRQTTELVVTVPAGFEALSNGRLIERGENADGKTVTFDWRQDKPHPAYLVTLVVGKFDIVRDEWQGVPVLYYVPKGHSAEVPYTFGRTPEMIDYFSKRFGVRYPWDKYAQVVAYQFGGGMENTSATTMGDILLDKRAQLDRNADWIVSHELAHQWWGDLVTCRDWTHTWLNEGFASYAEALWDEHAEGPDGYAYNMYSKSAPAISAGKSRPIMDRRYPNAGSMFDGRAYPKGAWVLHMLRRKLGDEAFFRCLQRYGTEMRLQSAETDDFRRICERETGWDLERFFYDWVERPGNPTLEVATEYLPEQRQAKVVIKQTQTFEPFQFPLKIAFQCAGSSAPVVLEQTVTDKETSVLFPLPGPPKVVEVDPDQAVLADIKETKSSDLWRGDLLGASNAASRIRAARHLGTTKAAEDLQALGQALSTEKYYGVRVEAANALAAAGGDAARDALLAGTNDADARVRKACLQNLAKFNKDDKIAAVARRVLEQGDPSYGVEGAALSLYAKQAGKNAVAVITPWLSKPSHNNVVESAALGALADTADLSVVETLLQWTQPSHPRRARDAAVQALVRLFKEAKPTPEQKDQIVKALTAALKSDSLRARFTVLQALPDLGSAAQALLPALDEMIKKEGNEQVRQAVKRAADGVREKARAADTGTSDTAKIREEVERLKKENAQLRERLAHPHGGGAAEK